MWRNHNDNHKHDDTSSIPSVLMLEGLFLIRQSIDVESLCPLPQQQHPL